MKHTPIMGTTRTESAPPVVSAVPYESSHQPGSRPTSPFITNTTVTMAPAAMGGKYASANRLVGSATSGDADCLIFMIIAVTPIAAAATASPTQMVTHCFELRGGPAMTAVASAVAPITTPPQPGTAVNAAARSIVSRM